MGDLRVMDGSDGEARSNPPNGCSPNDVCTPMILFFSSPFFYLKGEWNLCAPISPKIFGVLWFEPIPWAELMGPTYICWSRHQSKFFGNIYLYKTHELRSLVSNGITDLLLHGNYSF